MAGSRVSIFLPSLAGGGAERSTVMVANGLAARGIKVDLVLANAAGPYRNNVHAAVQVLDLRAASVLQALPTLARHLRVARPDVLLAAMSHANVGAALAHRMARSHARLVLSERVHLTSEFAEYRHLRIRLTRALMRWTYQWADQVIAVSRGVAEDLPRHVPLTSERIMTIYNPVIDDSLLAAAQAQASHEWFASREVPVVLAAGRLVAQKDFATLIRAFALVRRHRPLRLMILGEGELRAELLALAAELGVSDDLAMPGFDPNPFAAMRAARLFVLSSRFEGLPGVLIQAMACGTQVVSTDCPSGPREVLEGGRWGALVPVGDPRRLAEAMAATLDDSAPPDVRRRAADFSADCAVERYAQVLGLR